MWLVAAVISEDCSVLRWEGSRVGNKRKRKHRRVEVGVPWGGGGELRCMPLERERESDQTADCFHYDRSGRGFGGENTHVVERLRMY